MLSWPLDLGCDAVPHPLQPPPSLRHGRSHRMSYSTTSLSPLERCILVVSIERTRRRRYLCCWWKLKYGERIFSSFLQHHYNITIALRGETTRKLQEIRQSFLRLCRKTATGNRQPTAGALTTILTLACQQRQEEKPYLTVMTMRTRLSSLFIGLFLWLLVTMQSTTTKAFGVVRRPDTPLVGSSTLLGGAGRDNNSDKRRSPLLTTETTTALSLSINSNNNNNNSNSPKPKAAKTDGGDRGLILFILVMLVNVWLFSIPPYFRRVLICPDPLPTGCETTTPRTKCQECITAEEWKQGVVDYYQNGGGIQFDFSINPATLEANKKALQGVLGEQTVDAFWKD